MSIKPINFERHDIGARIKKSKAQFIWKFSLDSQMITIELICSHLSGKKKVFRDGRLIFETQKFGTSFQYPFQIGNHMLNIIQHGEHFELRIDNQSFQHLYHQDKTRRAFVFEGDEQNNRDNDYGGSGSHSSQNQQDNGFNFSAYDNYDGKGIGGGYQDSNSNKDFGYGGYKRGHTDVQWGNSNNNQRDNNNIRSKPYDDFSPQRNQGSNNNQPAKGGTFFEQFGSQPIIKKAEYINKQNTNQAQNVDNLLDIGGSNAQQKNNQNANFFDFDFSQGNTNQQQQQKQGTQPSTGFDFDFNAPSSQTTSLSKAFDFDSFGNNQQQQKPQQQQQQTQNNNANLLDTLFEQQPAQQQKSLDDLLGGSNVNNDNFMQGQNNQNTLNLQEQQKIQQLLATGYSNVNQQQQIPQQQQQQQFIPNPMMMNNNNNFNQNLNFNQQQQNFKQNPVGLGMMNNDKENLEQKLVNLDSLGGGLSNSTQPQFGVKSNADPFADAFNNNQKSMIPQNNQKDAFSFVQSQISQDQQQQQQQIRTSNPMQPNFNANTSINFGGPQLQPQQQQQQPAGNDFFFGFSGNTMSNQPAAAQQQQQQNNNFNFF